MKKVALILARGGSKGIPRKNIYPVDGKPLIYYTIKAALDSNVDEVWLSTDDKEIKEKAISFGAKVIDRPPELAQDFSKNEDAIFHFAKKHDFDILVYIQPTSPLLESSDINKGLSKMLTGQYDSVFTAYREHWVPRWTLDVRPIGWETYARYHRQQVEEKYVENGAFYMTTREALYRSKLRYSGNMTVIEMPFSRSIQIDTLDEIRIIEALIKNKSEEESK